MFNLVDLSGKRIVVVGASSGIGQQAAVTLSRLGARVVLVARREDKLRETLADLEGEGHGIHVMDVSKLDDIEGHVKQIVPDYGPVDGLVYTAGVDRDIPLLQTSPERLMHIHQTNFYGYIETVRQVCRKGRYNPGMRIVGVSSTAATVGNKSRTAYGSSKAAMDSAIKCIAKEMADRGICINNVAPAMTATEMYDRYLSRYGEDSEGNQRVLKRQYLGILETQDVANAIAFLISSAARHITGITLPVDGGVTTS